MATANQYRFDAGGLLKDRWFFSFVPQLFRHHGLALEEFRGLESDFGGTGRITHDHCASPANFF
jgi:hypothetical protein